MHSIAESEKCYQTAQETLKPTTDEIKRRYFLSLDKSMLLNEIQEQNLDTTAEDIAFLVQEQCLRSLKLLSAPPLGKIHWSMLPVCVIINGGSWLSRKKVSDWIMCQALRFRTIIDSQCTPLNIGKTCSAAKFLPALTNPESPRYESVGTICQYKVLRINDIFGKTAFPAWKLAPVMDEMLESRYDLSLPTIFSLVDSPDSYADAYGDIFLQLIRGDLDEKYSYKGGWVCHLQLTGGRPNEITGR